MQGRAADPPVCKKVPDQGVEQTNIPENIRNVRTYCMYALLVKGFIKDSLNSTIKEIRW